MRIQSILAALLACAFTRSANAHPVDVDEHQVGKGLTGHSYYAERNDATLSLPFVGGVQDKAMSTHDNALDSDASVDFHEAEDLANFRLAGNFATETIRIPVAIWAIYTEEAANNPERYHDESFFQEQIQWMNYAYRPAGIQFDLRSTTDILDTRLATTPLLHQILTEEQVKLLNVDEAKFARYYTGGYETLNLYYLSDPSTMSLAGRPLEAAGLCRFLVESPSEYEIKPSGCVINMHAPGLAVADAAIREMGHWLTLDDTWSESLSDTPSADGKWPSLTDPWSENLGETPKADSDDADGDYTITIGLGDEPSLTMDHNHMDNLPPGVGTRFTPEQIMKMRQAI